MANRVQEEAKEKRIAESRKEHEKLGRRMRAFYEAKEGFVGETPIIGTAVLFNGGVRLIVWDEDYCCTQTIPLCNINELLLKTEYDSFYDGDPDIFPWE